MLQCRDIDALMMDWLYGELGPQQAQSFSSHLEDCSRCHTELAAFERTRELVGVLPTEEPPAAVSALLIREAATRATPARATAEGGGFFAWLAKFFQPLQHPAMAALATLVLVAGVAGTFWMRGDGKLAEPEIDNTADTAPVAATADQGRSESAPEQPARATPPIGDSANEEFGGEGGDADKAAADEATPGPTFAPPPTKAPAKPVTAPGKDLSRRADLLEAKREKTARDLLVKSEREQRNRKRAESALKSNKKGALRPQSESVTNAVSGGDFLADGKADKKKPEPSPSFEGDGAATSQTYRAYRDRPDSWVAQQQLRITQAYNRRDCLTAAKIANDILDRTPELYTKSTKNLEGVKRCKAYVQKEAQKRRVARKNQRNSGKAAAGKRKARAKSSPKQAAPADLESSVESAK